MQKMMDNGIELNDLTTVQPSPFMYIYHSQSNHLIDNDLSVNNYI